MAKTAPPPDPYTVDVVAIAARAHERDRYLAALLGPRPIRRDLIALAAFAGEVGRIPAFVTEPMMGRIRLQWWRERLEQRNSGGHPIAAALIDTMARHDLAAAPLMELIDAHEDSLADHPFADLQVVLGYVDRIDGTLFNYAGRIAGITTEPMFTRDCGRAYGLARLIVETPATLAHGRNLLPINEITQPVELNTWVQLPVLQTLSTQSRQHLTAVRAQMPNVARRYRAPFCPIALVEPYLKALQSYAVTPVSTYEINPLRRVWRLWNCRLTGVV